MVVPAGLKMQSMCCIYMLLNVRDTVLTDIIKRCDKSCSSNTNRSRTNTINSSSIGCSARGMGLYGRGVDVWSCLVSEQIMYRWLNNGAMKLNKHKNML